MHGQEQGYQTAMLQPSFFQIDQRIGADRPAVETIQVLRVRVGEVGPSRGFSSILDRLDPRTPAIPDRQPRAVAAPKAPTGERGSSPPHARSISSARSNRTREVEPTRQSAIEESGPTRSDKVGTSQDEPHEAKARATDEPPRDSSETAQAESPDDIAALYVSLTLSTGGEALLHAVSVQTSTPGEDLSVESVEQGLSVSIDAVTLKVVAEDQGSDARQSRDSISPELGGLRLPDDLLGGAEGGDPSVLDRISHEQVATGSQTPDQGQDASHQAELPVLDAGSLLDNVAGLPVGTVEGEVSTDRTTLSALENSEAAVEQQAPAVPREGTRPVDAAQPRVAGEGSHTTTGDAGVLDPVGAQPLASEFFQSGDGQGSPTDGRGEQGAGQRAESSGQAPASLKGNGFGETIVSQQALDRGLSSEANGLRSAAPGQAGRLGLSQTWPTGDERASFIQSVSLDLEPADLGPVNVRIFMMDRTVHAHIRTEHADLGQGMLAHQHQLEVKLQHSGLEMGELRVTVDQQQLTRGDSQGWLRQQSEEPPGMTHPEARGVAPEEPSEDVFRPRRSGIMSFFA